MFNVSLTMIRTITGSIFPAGGFAVLDVNLDGRKDILLNWQVDYLDSNTPASTPYDQPMTWLNASAGIITVVPSAGFTTSNLRTHLIADLNNDGHSDLILFDSGRHDNNDATRFPLSTHKILLSAPSVSSFATTGDLSTLKGFWYQGGAGDFNGDDRIDLLSSPYGHVNDGTLRTDWQVVGFRNDGGGKFTVDQGLVPNQLTSTGSLQAAVATAATGNFNGDSFSDLAVGLGPAGKASPHAMAIYFGAPQGLSDTPNLILPTPDLVSRGADPLQMHVDNMAIGDLDGNGLDDVAITWFDQRQSFGQVFLQVSPGVFVDETASITGSDLAPLHAFGGEGFSIVDANNDGRMDLAFRPNVSNGRDLGRYVWLRQADGSFKSASSLGIDYIIKSQSLGSNADGLNMIAAAFADVDGNGLNDLIFLTTDKGPSQSAEPFHDYAAYVQGARNIGSSDFYVAKSGAPLTISAQAGVLANDVSVGGGALTASVAQAPVHGTLTLAANGSFTYTPNAAYVGTDSFFYTVTNAAGANSSGMVSLAVGGLAALTSPQQAIAELYLAYYNRAPDPGGLAYWLAKYTTPPEQSPGGVNPFYQNIGHTSAAFADPGQAETIALYPFLANPKAASYEDVVKFLQDAYLNLFARTVDGTDQGVRYWATSVSKSLGIPVPSFGDPVVDNTAPIPVANALIALIFGAQGNDAATIVNKVTVGLYYEAALIENHANFSQSSAHDAFAGVTSDPNTVLAAEARIGHLGAPAALPPTQAVQLVGLPSDEAVGHPLMA